MLAKICLHHVPMTDNVTAITNARSHFKSSSQCTSVPSKRVLTSILSSQHLYIFLSQYVLIFNNYVYKMSFIKKKKNIVKNEDLYLLCK